MQDSFYNIKIIINIFKCILKHTCEKNWFCFRISAFLNLFYFQSIYATDSIMTDVYGAQSSLDSTTNSTDFPKEIIGTYKKRKRSIKEYTTKHSISFDFQNEKTAENFLEFSHRNEPLENNLVIEFRNLTHPLAINSIFIEQIRNLKISGLCCSKNAALFIMDQGQYIFENLSYLPVLPNLISLDIRDLEFPNVEDDFSFPKEKIDNLPKFHTNLLEMICTKIKKLYFPADEYMCEGLLINLRSKAGKTPIESLNISNRRLWHHYVYDLHVFFPELKSLNISNSCNHYYSTEISFTKKGLKDFRVNPLKKLQTLKIADTEHAEKLFEIEELQEFFDIHPSLETVKLAKRWVANYSADRIATLQKNYPKIKFIFI